MRTPLSLQDMPAQAARLPLVVDGSAPPPGDSFVVWYSGDVGWGRADRAIASRLAARNLPVVGVDSLHYFWRRRSPEAAAEDLEAVIDTYAERWGRQNVVLVGYSFGGAAIPLIVPRLSPEARARLRRVVLLAPSRKGELVLRPWTLLEISGFGAQRLADEMKQMEQAGSIPVLCISDPHDGVAACDVLAGTPVVNVTGGHRFNGASDAVADAIAAGTGASPLQGGSALSSGP